MDYNNETKDDLALPSLLKMKEMELLNYYFIEISTPPLADMIKYAEFLDNFIQNGILEKEYEILEIGDERENLLIQTLKFFKNKVEKTSLIDYLQSRFPEDYLYYLLWHKLEQTNNPKKLSYYKKLFTVYLYFLNNFIELEAINFRVFSIIGINSASYLLYLYSKYLEEKRYIKESVLGTDTREWDSFCLEMKNKHQLQLKLLKPT